MSTNTYKITVAGHEMELPLCAISDKMEIAAFVIFGEVGLTEDAASELLKKCPEHDVILTAEAKGIPIGYEMARQGCRDYVVVRKSVKTYIQDPITAEVNSITTLNKQTLYLPGNKANKLKDKRVLIVDDVISTGASLEALEELVKKAGGNAVGRAAVLAEGDAAERDDIVFLEKLPLFPIMDR